MKKLFMIINGHVISTIVVCASVFGASVITAAALYKKRTNKD